MHSQASANSYDEIPYPGLSYRTSHPGRQLMVAKLFGMNPSPGDIKTCRMLELGCGAGGNLIPLAIEFPAGEFLGIDSSAVQVDEGGAAIRQLGLRNIRLEQWDILSLPRNLGEFDFVTAHGVYSWVSEPVRREILAISRRHLKPNGIAYVSYNVFPGWKLRSMMRDMMLYDAGSVANLRQRAEAALGFLNLLVDTIPAQLATYAHIVREERELLRRQDLGFLVHDSLQEVNEPCYFHQFTDLARQHGLRYLGESNVSEMGFALPLPPAASAAMAALRNDRIRQEQYIDFFTMRQFRCTLLVRDEVSSDYELRPERLSGLYLSAQAACNKANPDPRDAETLQFQHGTKQIGAGISAPLTKAALLHLGEIWPGSICFEGLVAAAQARLADSAALTRQLGSNTGSFAGQLLQMVAHGLIELHTLPDRFVRQPGARPQSSPWALWQLQRGSHRAAQSQGAKVTNNKHGTVMLDEVAARVLALLDGTRDRQRLSQLLLEEVLHRGLEIPGIDGKTGDHEQMFRAIAQVLDRNLDCLGSAALLIA